MTDPEDVLDDSPADFDSSLAYALHAEMRRLIIVTVVGSVLLPVGLDMFLDPTFFAGISELIFSRLIGLIVAVVGAALLYGGLIGILFKTITDANIVAQQLY